MKEKDINVVIDNVRLNCRAVAVIIENDKVLFQKRKQDQFWALPGGKIHVLEKGEDTIKRELKEELGIKDFSIERFNSVSEYFFGFDTEKYHQYIFSYIVSVDEHEWIFQKEEFDGIEENENLLYKWFPLAELKEAPIKPDFIAEQIMNSKNNNIQFISYTEENSI